MTVPCPCSNALRVGVYCVFFLLNLSNMSHTWHSWPTNRVDFEPPGLRWIPGEPAHPIVSRWPASRRLERQHGDTGSHRILSSPGKLREIKSPQGWTPRFQENQNWMDIDGLKLMWSWWEINWSSEKETHLTLTLRTPSVLLSVHGIVVAKKLQSPLWQCCWWENETSPLIDLSQEGANK